MKAIVPVLIASVFTGLAGVAPSFGIPGIPFGIPGGIPGGNTNTIKNASYSLYLGPKATSPASWRKNPECDKAFRAAPEFMKAVELELGKARYNAMELDELRNQIAQIRRVVIFYHEMEQERLQWNAEVRKRMEERGSSLLPPPPGVIPPPLNPRRPSGSRNKGKPPKK